MPGPATLAVLDVEFTSWEGARERRWQGPGEEREIVQIGAITLVDDASLAETGALDVLVKPRINPKLSDYFIRLTGITQERVERDGIAFAEAVARLERFLAGVRAVYSFGTDYTIVRHNCALNGIAFPFDEAMFRNAREVVGAALGPEIAQVDSSQLPAAMGFAASGAGHQGVDDCRCVAEALRILRRRNRF